MSGNLMQPNYRAAQNLRPALTYYLNNPLVCVERSFGGTPLFVRHAAQRYADPKQKIPRLEHRSKRRGYGDGFLKRYRCGQKRWP